MSIRKEAGRLVLVMTAAALIAATRARAAENNPAELWPTQSPAPADAGTLSVRLGKLAAAARTMSPELGPAIKFEEMFLRILAAEPTREWLTQAQAFAAAKASDPVSAGVREVARAWLARAEMEQISTALDQFYGENVRYPATWAQAEKLLPTGLRTDPWGETWVYRTPAPKGGTKEAPQSYELGPKRHPKLGGLRDAVGGRQAFTPPAWQVTPQTTGSSHALEFRQNGVPKGPITAGGTIGDYMLLYVSDHWALMAATDQLFTVSF